MAFDFLILFLSLSLLSPSLGDDSGYKREWDMENNFEDPRLNSHPQRLDDTIQVGHSHESSTQISVLHEPEDSFEAPLRKGIYDLQSGILRDVTILENMKSYLEQNEASDFKMKNVFLSGYSPVQRFLKISNFVLEILGKMDNSLLSTLRENFQSRLDNFQQIFPLFENAREHLKILYFDLIKTLGENLSPLASKYENELVYTVELMLAFGYTPGEVYQLFSLLKLPVDKIPVNLNSIDNQTKEALNFFRNEIAKEREEHSRTRRRAYRDRLYSYSRSKLADKFAQIPISKSSLVDFYDYVDDYENLRLRGETDYDYREENYNSNPMNVQKSSNRLLDKGHGYNDHKLLEKLKQHLKKDHSSGYGHAASHSHSSDGYGYMMAYAKDPFKVLAGLAFLAFLAPLLYFVISSINPKGKRSVDESLSVDLAFDQMSGWLDLTDGLEDRLPNIEFYSEDQINGLANNLNYFWGIVDTHDADCHGSFLTNVLQKNSYDSLSFEAFTEFLLLGLLGHIKGKDTAKKVDLYTDEFLKNGKIITQNRQNDECMLSYNDRTKTNR